MMGNNPSENKGRTLPVEKVSWDDTQQFIAKLNQKTGQKYRLPSEAEWEYAARAGTTTEWSHGNDESKLGNYAWYGRNSGSKTQEVGQKLPNSLGLYDMHGNVWEWTQDCWHNNYSNAPTDGSAWTTGCTTNIRVLRGGSWNYSPAHLRSAFRIRSNPDLRGSSYGFRLARNLVSASVDSVEFTLKHSKAEQDKRIKELEAVQSAGPSANYGAKVVAAIRPNIASIKELSVSLAAEYDVYTDSSGRITHARIRKRSGDAYWDDAALQAILKTERLPLDDNGRVPSPMTIMMRP